MSQYQKKHLPTHTYPDHQSSFICFLHLLRSMASFLFNLCAWQSFCTTSVQVIFAPALHLGLAPSASYSIHAFLHVIVVFFAAHAHTIATCFAVVPRLYHLVLVSLCLNSTWILSFVGYRTQLYCLHVCMDLYVCSCPSFTSYVRTASGACVKRAPSALRRCRRFARRPLDALNSRSSLSTSSTTSHAG